MTIIFADHAWNDYLYWQRTDKQVLKRINTLIKDIQRTGHRGTGKPEPLRHALAGYWSRRINKEHRIVYKIENNNLFIA